MISRTYRDPPPSYAEATGALDSDNQTDTRCHSHSTTNTSLTPAAAAAYPQNSGGSSSSVATHIFPPAFCVYCQSTRHYILGESRYLPLYAVSTHSSLSSKPDLVIYNGASEDAPPLAFVDHEPFSRSAGITLPARQGSHFPASHELLESGGPFTRTLSFDMRTAASDGRREHFEWRHSSGVEIEALGGRQHSEVVAVWVATGMFMARVLRFQFLGSGADGSLGDRWAVMAVASALAIWNRDPRARNRGLATASF
ncbi:hypothetical protein FHL15_006438 [Xylaria flabelliformis]|uniref:Uncharacterized protein n=1 Tax=Xylaria flabelliformis TaxID=2512241 RepID=A0A553HXT5_9PEZI|nr:hypothetical protein FHL15_006438 [Xylaria flabelliformis]